MKKSWNPGKIFDLRRVNRRCNPAGIDVRQVGCTEKTLRYAMNKSFSLRLYNCAMQKWSEWNER